MKFDDLRSVGHNIADSLASGIGMLIGVYEMDVFGEARRNPDGVIEVDFLNGNTTVGEVSPHLGSAISLYCEALPELCERQGVSVSAFRRLSARFSSHPAGGRVSVVVEDIVGRRAVDEYIGNPLRRVRLVDRLGRVRRERGVIARRT